MASQDWFEKDFYAVLGVAQDASADAIKKAYRKLARQHHPDANAGDSVSERRFKEVGEAYSVLSDPEQRQQYDAVRAMARGGARFSSGPGGPAGAGSAGFEDVFSTLFNGGGGPQNVRFGPGQGAGGTSFEDLLGMFGAASGPGAQPSDPFTGFRAPRAPRRGQDLAAQARLTFRQAAEGALLSLTVEEPGAGTRTVRARIPGGVRDGQKVRLKGKGRPAPGGEPGDLLVTVHVEPHPVFTSEGEDVRVNVPVTITEAALGARVEVPAPDGGTVTLKVPAGTPSGRTLRVKGRGLRSSRRTGDLLVTVQVAVPQRLDGAARQALEDFAAATAGTDPRADLLAAAQAAQGEGASRV